LSAPYCRDVAARTGAYDSYVKRGWFHIMLKKKKGKRETFPRMALKVPAADLPDIRALLSSQSERALPLVHL
jgi:hypothetical protein